MPLLFQRSSVRKIGGLKRFLHYGIDEETAPNTKNYPMYPHKVVEPVKQTEYMPCYGMTEEKRYPLTNAKASLRKNTYPYTF